ncbi:MAG: VWA domain-containing protein [Bacteroidota bacterium]
MGKWNTRTLLLLASLPVSFFNSLTFAQQSCTDFFVPPANLNGMEVTETHTGSVGTYGSAFTSCSITSGADAAWLGSSGPFTYTLHFSAPVRQLTMQITATGNPGEESFEFTTNAGNPAITTTNSCYTKVEGNKIFSGLDSPGNGGGGIFVIKGSSDFTELTISGNGGLNGSLFSFCANVVKGTCNAGTEAPVIKEPRMTVSCQGGSVKLGDIPAMNQPRGVEMTWHSSTPATRSNLVWSEQVKEGTYYAAFYDKKADCFSANTTKLEVVSASGPKVFAGEDITVCQGSEITLNASGAQSYKWSGSISQNVPFKASYSTTYTVTGTDANGCSGSDNIHVTVNSLPHIDAGQDRTIKKGEEVTLKAFGALTYKWDKGVEQGVSFFPEKTDNYTVTGADANGCIDEDEVLITIEGAVISKLEEIPLENFDATLFKAVNVVFVLDISNSMSASNKLELLKQSVSSLLDIVRSEDKIALVTYASEASVIVPPTSGSSGEEIRKKVEALHSMGSTAGVDGIKLGFKQAKKAFIEGGTNLVIVITDGAFNEHMGDYLGVIEKYERQNINFSVVGIKNSPKDETNMREAAERGKGSYVPVFKVSDTKQNLILEIKKHAFKL